MSEKVHEVPEPDLLPCPFCGGKAEVERQAGAGDVWRWWCSCDYCNAETRTHDREADAIAAWNRRTATPTIDRSDGEES